MADSEPTAAQFSGVDVFPPKHIEGDKVRTTASQLLFTSLSVGDLPEGTLDPQQLAVSLEQKLYDVHGGTTDSYRKAAQSRAFGLWGRKKYVGLWENVLTGVVSIDKFAVMPEEEMVSDEIKKMRDRFVVDSTLERNLSVTAGPPSSLFKCGKCGKKNCTSTQLQWGNADERMTTFVFCMECSNHWKFC